MISGKPKGLHTKMICPHCKQSLEVVITSVGFWIGKPIYDRKGNLEGLEKFKPKDFGV